MATHTSILAWRIPWTEKPGVLQSMGSLQFMGSQRVGHDRATNTFIKFTFRFTTEVRAKELWLIQGNLLARARQQVRWAERRPPENMEFKISHVQK